MAKSPDQVTPLLDVAPVAVLQIDPTGRVRGINAWFAELTGHERDQVTGLDALELMAPGDGREQLLAHLARSLAGAATSGAVTTVVTASVQLEWRFEQLHDGSEHPAGLIAIGTRVTEQPRAQETPDRLQVIIDSMFAFVGLFAPDGSVLELNRRAVEVTGKRRDEVVGQRVWELAILYDEERPRVRDAIQAASGGATSRFDLQFALADGRGLTIDATFCPLYDHAGRVVQIVGSGIDVSDRKHAEQQAEAARVMLRSVLDATPDWIFAKDGDHRLLFANRAFAASQGLLPDEIVGRLDTELWPVEQCVGDLAKGIRGFHADDDLAMSGQVVHNPIDPARVADGTTRIFDTVKLPMYADDGRIYGSLAYARDVTESRVIEEQRRSSEARYRALVEHAPVGVYVHDGQTILFSNPAMAKVFGVSDPAELVGQPLMSIVHPDDRPVVRQRIEQLFHRDVNPIFRGRIVRIDGKVVHADIMATRCGFEGKPAIQVVLVDVTETVRAEAERRQLEAQLHQAQRMEAIGTLAAGVAHDFNNLLAAIGGYAALAERDVGRAHPAVASLREIQQATDRAAELVRQILSFSRPRHKPDAVVALRPIVEEVWRLLRATIPAGIQLTASFEEDVPNVLAEPTQIHQVLLNLCTNAWHAMNRGAGRIDLRLTGVTLSDTAIQIHPELRPGRYARASVNDTGHGMDEETLARIFEPFFTTKPVGQGTGLGLSVVHGIMKSHGAVIAVTSRRGEGTTFDLYFPALDAPSTPIVTEAPRAPAVQPGRLRVLFIDDESAIVALAKRILEGHEVTGFTQATLAIAALRAEPTRFDVLITDYNMPGMSGLDVVSEVRRVNPVLPVAIISGYINADLQRFAADAGIKNLLHKPYSAPQLCAFVQQLADDRPERARTS